mmetsp:Transcript_1925/g.6017  ORF Transcript_1925/g.6017 Transcript_1925/m.6017 type:complete len:378 (+) Transcript_1925:194-1327(+)
MLGGGCCSRRGAHSRRGRHSGHEAMRVRIDGVRLDTNKRLKTLRRGCVSHAVRSLVLLLLGDGERLNGSRHRGRGRVASVTGEHDRGEAGRAVCHQRGGRQLSAAVLRFVYTTAGDPGKIGCGQRGRRERGRHRRRAARVSGVVVRCGGGSRRRVRSRGGSVGGGRRRRRGGFTAERLLVGLGPRLQAALKNARLLNRVTGQQSGGLLVAHQRAVAEIGRHGTMNLPGWRLATMQRWAGGRVGCTQMRTGTLLILVRKDHIAQQGIGQEVEAIGVRYQCDRVRTHTDRMRLVQVLDLQRGGTSDLDTFLFHTTIHVEGLALQKIGQLNTDQKGFAIDTNHTKLASKVFLRRVLHLCSGRLGMFLRLASSHWEENWRA